MVACLVCKPSEVKDIEEQVNNGDENPMKPKKHYLLNDSMYPITLHQLKIFASQQRVELEELVKVLDENGYVIQYVKAKLVPCFTYLVLEETIFTEFDPEGYVKLKIMTKEYYKETR